MSTTEMIARLIQDMVESLQRPEDNPGYAASLCMEGFKGFRNMTTAEVRQAYASAFGA